jgi:hypothetical protein
MHFCPAEEAARRVIDPLLDEFRAKASVNPLEYNLTTQEWEPQGHGGVVPIKNLRREKCRMNDAPECHHCRSIRLPGWDYTGTGGYFVTLCMQDRAWPFGAIVEGEITVVCLYKNRHIACRVLWYRSLPGSNSPSPNTSKPCVKPLVRPSGRRIITNYRR